MRAQPITRPQANRTLWTGNPVRAVDAASNIETK